ncbi:glutathione S-transferase A-like [Ptychodera flava]|uniref:glutathione S-transferase A-like n=1 Tax=Ptychodera flava TaxID=63121 RepID=UPI00396A0603
MASEIFLIWGSGSGPCWRVMITLEEKGLQGYGNEMVSMEKLRASKEKPANLIKLNPRAQVPAMKHGDAVVNESLAAMLYLEDTFKTQGTRLLPESPAEKGLTLQRMVEVVELERKMYGLGMYMMANKDNLDEAKVAQLKEELKNEIKVWDGYLEKMGEKSYIAGKEFTLADCSAISIIAMFPRQGIDLEKHAPSMAKYYNMVKDRPSVQASWPPHFKTTPSPKLLGALY